VKVVERFLACRMRQQVKIDEMKFDFVEGKVRCDIHCEADA